jgi:hypothetical protein
MPRHKNASFIRGLHMNLHPDFKKFKLAPTKRPCFYKVLEDMHVFKKTYTWGQRVPTSCITNLIIPAGATIYVDYRYSSDSYRWNRRETRKLRASTAIVHSSFTTEGKEYVDVSFSGRGPGFLYVAGNRVNPEYKFSYKEYQCESGIHFFLRLKDALEY